MIRRKRTNAVFLVEKEGLALVSLYYSPKNLN